jgi:hypothetical protein
LPDDHPAGRNLAHHTVGNLAGIQGLRQLHDASVVTGYYLWSNAAWHRRALTALAGNMASYLSDGVLAVLAAFGQRMWGSP